MAEKKALVLSGGGVKGAYQVGVLDNLILKENNDYEIFTGISVGALNASFLARAPSGQKQLENTYLELVAIWNTIKRNRQIYRNWLRLPIIGHIFGLFIGNSLFNSKPLQKMVEKYLKDAEINRELYIGAVAYGTGEYRSVDRDVKDLHKWVSASAAFPFFLTPIKIHENEEKYDFWFDGGVRTITPLNEAIEAGATSIDVVITSPRDVSMKDPMENIFGTTLSSPDFAFRSLEMLLNEIMLRDLKFANLYNQLANKTIENFEKRYLDIRVFAPSEHLIDNSLRFRRHEIQQMIELGKQTTGVSLKQFMT